MNKAIFIIMLACSYSLGFAQTSRVTIKAPQPDKPILFQMNQGSVDIEGYDGDEIIIENAPVTNTTMSKEAKGLKQITAFGKDKEDSTIKPKIQEATIKEGLEDEQVMRITIPGSFRHLAIKVPQNAAIEVQMDSFLSDGKLSVKNVNSVGIYAFVPFIELSNVADFEMSTGGAYPGKRASDKITLSNIKWTDQPVMINGKPRPRRYAVATNNASVELLIPATIKANINYFSANGQVFSNLAVAPVAPAAESIKSFEQYFSKKNELKTIQLNGGGINVNISTNYGNIYLKKQ